MLLYLAIAKQIASEDAALSEQGDRWKVCEAELVDAQQKVEELQSALKEKAKAKAGG